MLKVKASIVMAILIMVTTTGQAMAGDILTGKTRLACEAILCLSTGSAPGECSPSLSHYFSIKKKKFSKTLKARLNFLNLCPVSDQTPEMRSLVKAISRGAGRCDASSLNRTLRRGINRDTMLPIISNKMPAYCAAYTGHEYTDFESGGILPRYVGTPETGGFWASSKDYQQALIRYERQLKRSKSPQWGLN